MFTAGLLLGFMLQHVAAVKWEKMVKNVACLTTKPGPEQLVLLLLLLSRAHESSSNNRTRLEETTDPTPHGDQRLHVQQ
jgi:hypothetical protein